MSSNETPKTNAQLHAERIAAGAICTGYDNLYIQEFDDEHPEPTLPDFVDKLAGLSSDYDPDVHYEDSMASHELSMAAAEISRRLAGPIQNLPAQPGRLVDAEHIKVGQLLDLSRIWAEESTSSDRAQAAARGPIRVTEYLGPGGGDVFIHTEAGSVVVPIGTLLPVIDPAETTAPTAPTAPTEESA